MSKKPCTICSTETATIFNINLRRTSICEDCARSIFIQQAVWYVDRSILTPEIRQNVKIATVAKLELDQIKLDDVEKKISKAFYDTMYEFCKTNRKKSIGESSFGEVAFRAAKKITEPKL